MRPEFRDIEKAAERICSQVRHTPLIEDDGLNAQIGGRLLIKCENLQRTGSFKFRGAFNAVSQVNAREVVAYSSGNHAQGVALAAKVCGKKATIIMPSDAPEIKKNNTLRLGAELKLYDRWREDRDKISQDLVLRKDAALIKPYDDLHVIAGQGTTGLEMANTCIERNIRPDQAIICCGGGGLTAGAAIALSRYFPNIELFTCEPAGFDDTARSLVASRRLCNTPGCQTICDAIVTNTPGEMTFPIIKERLKGGLVVDDDEVRDAMVQAFSNLKLVIEPGGAVALAAALCRKIETGNKITLVTVSGGNVDASLFAKILNG